MDSLQRWESVGMPGKIESLQEIDRKYILRTDINLSKIHAILLFDLGYLLFEKKFLTYWFANVNEPIIADGILSVR